MKSSIGSVIAGTALALGVTGCFSPDAALAQSSAGGGAIQGTVKDATGGVIPGASVIIRQLETGLVTNTVANNEGFFSTPPLNIGKYKIRVESPGMKAWEGELLLETARTAEVNPVLTIGEVSDTLVVSGNIAGTNSADVVDLNNPTAIGRGVAVRGLDDQQPSLRIHEWNLTIEKQLSKNTVFRLSYKGKHGVNTDQLYEINPAPNDYIWYVTTGRPLPSGEFASVARRPYDQTAYTEVRILQRSGYINSSTWSGEIERRFTDGLGFQAFYTLTNALRLAGNSFRDDVASRPEVYLPGTVPTDFKKLNRFLFYDRDTAIPKHRVRWNWNYELPFGKGKPFLNGASGFLAGLVGGWKLSGTGTILNTWFSMPTNHWGATSICWDRSIG